MKGKNIKENIFDDYRVILAVAFLLIFFSLLISALMITILGFLINLI
jgi:hypothetical protein